MRFKAGGVFTGWWRSDSLEVASWGKSAPSLDPEVYGMQMSVSQVKEFQRN